MLYDPAKDPLWGEVKVLHLKPALLRFAAVGEIDLSSPRHVLLECTFGGRSDKRRTCECIGSCVLKAQVQLSHTDRYDCSP